MTETSSKLVISYLLLYYEVLVKKSLPGKITLITHHFREKINYLSIQKTTDSFKLRLNQ